MSELEPAAWPIRSVTSWPLSGTVQPVGHGKWSSPCIWKCWGCTLSTVFIFGPLTIRHWGDQAHLKKGNKTGWRDRSTTLKKEWLMGLGLFRLEKWSLCWDLTTSYSCLKGGCNHMGVRFLAQVASDRMRWNGLKLSQGRFELYIREILFTEIVVRHQNKLPRKETEWSPQKCSKKMWHLGIVV